MEILQSTDYSKFETITGNRNVIDRKVERIKADIEGGLNLLPYFPILVYKTKNDTYGIIDGQHRFNVSMQLSHPVYFVVCDEISLQQIATINSKQDKWKWKDFLRCYIELGNENYKTLDSILSRYKIKGSTAVELLMMGKIGSRKDSTIAFQQGKFKVNFYDETVELLDLNHKLFDRYVFYTDRNLIQAVYEIKKKGLCDFDILLGKINQAPVLMDKQGSVKDYIYNIERVYNHNNQHRKVIF